MNRVLKHGEFQKNADGRLQPVIGRFIGYGFSTFSYGTRRSVIFCLDRMMGWKVCVINKLCVLLDGVPVSFQASFFASPVH
jgi:hypothetical protein